MWESVNVITTWTESEENNIMVLLTEAEIPWCNIHASKLVYDKRRDLPEFGKEHLWKPTSDIVPNADWTPPTPGAKQESVSPLPFLGAQGAWPTQCSKKEEWREQVKAQMLERKIQMVSSPQRVWQHGKSSEIIEQPSRRRQQVPQGRYTKTNSNDLEVDILFLNLKSK